MKSTVLLKKNREDMVDYLVYMSGRELGATQVMYLQAIADRLGINITDMRCLNFIYRTEETISAGDLVEISGLTTGAVTGVIDRLEEAGFIKRDRGAADRRLVIIKPVPEMRNRVRGIFELINRRRRKMIGGLNDHELMIIKNFIEGSITILKEEIDALRLKSV